MARRSAALCLLFLFGAFALAACYTTKPITREELETADARKLELKLTYPTGTVTVLENWTLEYPWIVGTYEEDRGVLPGEPVEKYPQLRRFNLDEATRIESYKLSPARIAGLSAGALLAALVGTTLLLALTSCPAVYVVDGTQATIAGEAYPGAIFRSVQRDDLLPLPHASGRALTLRLVNHNPEIQYTDSARLVLVEHSPDERARATPDGRPVLIGPSRSPFAATDLEGVDVLDRVRGADNQVWQSDLDRAFLSGRRTLREGVVATFEPVPGNAALEIATENTLWMAAVFERGFSMLGGTFGPAMRAANRAERASIDAWRVREGVDLKVEVLRGGTWTTAGIVQTPGMAALRTMVLPLGDVEGSEVQVRVSGGFGFWRIGSLALTTIVDASPASKIITATDAPPSMRAKDGRYHVLSKYGQMVELRFDLPASDRERSLFLETSGWYNPLPPRSRLPQVSALNTLRSTPGGLAQLGLDLYATHRDQLQQASAR